MGATHGRREHLGWDLSLGRRSTVHQPRGETLKQLGAEAVSKGHHSVLKTKYYALEKLKLEKRMGFTVQSHADLMGRQGQTGACQEGARGCPLLGGQ